MISRIINPEKAWGYLAHLFFFALIFLAAWYWQERLLADSSYYVFKIINAESFHIEHNRFILIFSQTLPLIAVKLGLGLKSIILVYSLGCILFFYLLFLLISYHYKEKRAALVILLIQFLGITGGFFVPLFELYFCAGLLVLFMVVLKKHNRKYSYILLLPLQFFILTGHPFAWLLFYTVLLFHAAETRFHQWKRYIPLVAFSVCILFFQFYFASEYEKEKTGGFLHLLTNTNYNYQYLKTLIVFLYDHYTELIIFLLLVLFVIFYERKKITGSLFFVSFLFILFIVSTASGNFDPSRYQEQVYFPLSFIAAYFYFFHLVSNHKKIRLFEYGVITGLFILKLTAIIHIGEILKDRTRTMKYLIGYTRSLPGNKFIINEKNLEHEKSSSCNWSYPIETLLLSSAESGKKSATICTTEDIEFNENISRLNKNNYLFRRWETEELSALNNEYFRIFPTDYFYLNKEGYNTREELENIRLIPLSEYESLNSNEYFLVPAEIQNINENPLFSPISNQVCLSYEWHSSHEQITGELKTPLIADVYHALRQDVLIRTPVRKGMYVLYLCLILDDEYLPLSQDSIKII